MCIRDRQKLSEKAVVAMPLEPIVNGAGEHCPADHQVHESLAAKFFTARRRPFAEQGVAQGGTEAVDDRCPEQAITHDCGLLGEPPLHEIGLQRRHLADDAAPVIAVSYTQQDVYNGQELGPDQSSAPSPARR